jgi:HEAT repeat protein
MTTLRVAVSARIAVLARFAVLALVVELTLAAGSGSSPVFAAETVTRYAGPAAPLTDRWKWAVSEAARNGDSKGYWVGYGIERMMGERSFIGSSYSDERRNKPSLRELVTGVEVNDLSEFTGGHDGSTSMSGTMNFGDGDTPERMVKKDVGILFHVGGGRSPDIDEIDELEVSNFSLRVDLGGDPLLWLGAAGYDESVGFLESRYDDASTDDAKKRFVMAIGIHDESPKAIEFLKEILTGRGDTDLRGDAAFWLGQTDNDAARKVLKDVAWNDPSEDVREKCVFALSQMGGEATIDELINLARNHKDDETRKNAAFWLGQKASDRAVGALKDIAYNDEDTEVQRSAMFALAQVEENGGSVDELINIARTHPNPKIRKDAIFWLGQSEDPKALAVLVEMVKGK